MLPGRVPGYKRGDLHRGACASAARPCSWLQARGSSEEHALVLPGRVPGYKRGDLQRSMR